MKKKASILSLIAPQAGEARDVARERAMAMRSNRPQGRDLQGTSFVVDVQS